MSIANETGHRDPVFTAAFARDDEETPDLEQIVSVLEQHIRFADENGKRLVLKLYMED